MNPEANVSFVPRYLPLKKYLLWALSMPALHLALILLCGLFAYANTFHVPFVFDDTRGIVDNHLIKNLGNFWPPSGTRWFGTLTFALNYAAGGLNVTGYHYVNLAIHLAAALLVYRLVALALRTPLFQPNRASDSGTYPRTFAPLVAAFLFVSHPIQTQAVTYVVQRYASLATLLFLAATVSYLQARLEITDGNSYGANRCRAIAWYAAALLVAVLAMKTKEIAFTLPLAITLCECVFFPERRLAERLGFLFPVSLTLLIIPLALASAGADGVEVVSRESDISRHDYLLTQFRVVVTYLRLLIFPVNQMIDYAYPVSTALFAPPIFLSLGLLAALFLGGLTILARGVRGTVAPEFTLVGFGMMWFFITLSVESSVIPIADVIFEHRLYLPTVGLFMAAAMATLMAVERLAVRSPRSGAGVAAIITLLLLALPVAAHLRNRVWRSGMALWEDAANKAPDNARARLVLGRLLIDADNIDQAIARYQEALRIRPDYCEAMVSLGNAYLAKGLLEEGHQQYLKVLDIGKMDYAGWAGLMMNIGSYHLRKGEVDRAIVYYRYSLSKSPDVAATHYSLGLAYTRKGMAAEAAREFARAKQLNPDLY